MISANVNDEMGNDTGKFNVSFSGTFTDEQLMPNTNYCFNVSTRNIPAIGSNPGKYYV